MTIPTLSFLDRCIFNAMGSGTGSFVVASSVTGYQTPAQAGAISGAQYGYAAQSADLTQWEYGYGTYTGASLTLTRTVIGNSLGTTNPVNFTNSPQVLITALGETLSLPLIPLTPTPPQFGDTIVGVTLAGNDVRFNTMQLGVLIPATSNLNFYVATTGNDSNPGTIASPFLTIQHAVNFAATFNYEGLYFPTINIAAGTYSSPSTITLPQLINVLNSGNGTVQGAGNTSTIILKSVNGGLAPGQSVFLTNGAFSNWNFANLRTDHGGYHYTSFGNSSIAINNTTVDINDTSNSGVAIFFGIDTGGNIGIGTSTLNINVTSFIDFFQGFRLPNFSLFGVTINWPAGPFPACVGSEIIDTQFNSVGTAAVFWISVTNNNVAGLKLDQKCLIVASGGDVFLQTDNGLISDFPGTATFPTFLDNTCYLLGSSNSTSGVGLTSITLSTVSTLIVPSTWVFAKDSNAPTGAGIRAIANDAGTFVTVGSGAPYKVSAPLTGATVTSSYGLRSNVVNPAGTLATLTVDLPTGVLDGDITRISFTQAITTLTIASTDSSSIVGAPTSAAAGSAFQFIYDHANTTWYIN